MKIKILMIAFISLISSICLANGAFASRGQSDCQRSEDVSVKGYFKKNGKYIKPACRTKPNKLKKDNWSTIGNVNPYTGKKGTKLP